MRGIPGKPIPEKLILRIAGGRELGDCLGDRLAVTMKGTCGLAHRPPGFV